MQYVENHPYDLFINFGIYRITFNGTSKSTLKDAREHFKEQIALITKDWDH